MSASRLKPRSLAEAAVDFPAYRQSLLATMDNCALAALFDLEGSSYNNAAQARGIIFHRFAAELLRTLRDTGNETVPHEEAMQILYEVSRQRDVPPEDVVIVPARERRVLRICALALANVPLNMSKLFVNPEGDGIEQRFFTSVQYPDPDGGGTIDRFITGQPDAILVDPPDGLIVLDWKTAPSAPAKPTSGQQDHWTGDHNHVSYEGYFQQRTYAALLMRNFPAVNRVTLREYYVLPREARTATVPREALEHIEQELGVLVELLDRGLTAGSRWKGWRPSPGKHCDYCSRPTSCPIEREARAFDGGGITSEAQAARIAAEDVLAVRVHKEAHEALKSYHDMTGRPIPVRNAKGRVEYRWGATSTGSRRFGIYPVETSDRGALDEQLVAAFEEAAERKAVVA